MTGKPRILVLFSGVVLFGAERGNLEALVALKAHGAEILCLIVEETWVKEITPALDARGIAWRKVPYVHLAHGLSWHTLLLGNPLRFIRANTAFMRALRDFQPTHVHAFSQLAVVNFATGLTLSRIPLIFRAGDEPTLHNRVWRATWRFVVNRAQLFVANSRFVARSLVASGVSADRIHVIYNAPPGRPELAEANGTLALPCGGSLMAYVGQIAEHKGPHVLINAFRQVAAEFPAARLAIAGRISEWEGDAWARALRDATQADAAIGHRVFFLGTVANVPGLLERCTFGVVPSLFADPAPNVIMEFKRAALAVIGFARGGIPELIEHGVDGLICTEPTESALADALRRYLQDPEQVRTHGLASLASLDRLGVAQFGEKWRDVCIRALPNSQSLARQPNAAL